MDSLDRKNIMDMLMSRLGANGGGIYNRNMGRRRAAAGAIPMNPAFARQSEVQMTTSAPESNEDYNAKTARMLMDRQYGNNDAQSPYYIGRWNPEKSLGGALAKKLSALQNTSDRSPLPGSGIYKDLYPKRKKDPRDDLEFGY